MKSNPSARFFSLLFIALIILLTGTVSISNTNTNDIIVICNENVPENSLTRREVEWIFLGKKTTWSNDQKIIYVILSGKGKADTIHTSFLKKYVNKTPTQFNNYWKRMIFTGMDIPPRSFKTVESMLEFVRSTEGAIAYIEAGTEIKNLKIIEVTEK